MKKHFLRIEWLLFTNEQNKDQQFSSIRQIYFSLLINET